MTCYNSDMKYVLSKCNLNNTSNIKKVTCRTTTNVNLMQIEITVQTFNHRCCFKMKINLSGEILAIIMMIDTNLLGRLPHKNLCQSLSIRLCFSKNNLFSNIDLVCQHLSNIHQPIQKKRLLRFGSAL